MLQPYTMTASSIAEKVREKKLSVGEVAEFYASRIEKNKGELNTHLYFEKSDLEAEVERVEGLLKNKKDLPLAGVPVGIKDNICTQSAPTTCASKILENYRPPYDAKVIEKLKNAGALVFSKLNMDEFAMGSSNENSAFGPVKNPWDLSRVPGGSSGASAATVAADLNPCSLGSDTGGSIRQPASLCGVVGLKPTYGRVSRFGLVAFGSSLDQIGPFTRDVKDAALMLDVLAGWDERDSTSHEASSCQTFKNLNSKRTLKIGVVKEFYSDDLNSEVQEAFDASLEVYKSLGCEIKTVSLPRVDLGVSAYYLVATAEASSNLARYDGIRYGFQAPDPANLTNLYEQSRSLGFGKEVKQRIMLGTFALSSGYYDAYYGKAQKVREMIRRDFQKAFQEVDLIASPTSPTTAFPIGERADDPLAMYLSDIYTIGANLAGIPGISVPCGFDNQGLPIGLQLMAPMFGEQTLLDGALIYEQKTKWHEQKKPNI